MLYQLNIGYWRHHNLFSFGWWFLVAGTTVSAIVWWKLVDRKRIVEVLMFGLLITVIATFLDSVGTDFLLWGYPTKILPLAPPLLFVDYFTLPTLYSLIYQYCSRWRTFFWGMVIMSIVTSFAGEPLLVWLNIYDMHRWRHIYSFPLYILLGICVKALVDMLMRIHDAHQQ